MSGNPIDELVKPDVGPIARAVGRQIWVRIQNQLEKYSQVKAYREGTTDEEREQKRISIQRGLNGWLMADLERDIEDSDDEEGETSCELDKSVTAKMAALKTREDDPAEEYEGEDEQSQGERSSDEESDSSSDWYYRVLSNKPPRSYHDELEEGVEVEYEIDQVRWEVLESEDGRGTDEISTTVNIPAKLMLNRKLREAKEKKEAEARAAKEKANREEEEHLERLNNLMKRLSRQTRRTADETGASRRDVLKTFCPPVRRKGVTMKQVQKMRGEIPVSSSSSSPESKSSSSFEAALLPAKDLNEETLVKE